MNVDFRPTVSLDEQRKVDANEPGQPQGVAPGNAQPAKVDSVVRKLDVLLLGAAKKSVASDIVRNVETVGDTLVKKGVLTKEELSSLKTLAEDAANKMRALDKFSGREIAKSMEIKRTTTVLAGADDDGVIDLDDDDDDKGVQNPGGDDEGVIDLDAEDDNIIVTHENKGNQALAAETTTETAWATKQAVDENDPNQEITDNAVKNAIEAQLALSDALSKFNDKLAASRKVDAALQDQFTELQFQCDRRASEIDSVVFRMADLVQKNVGKGKVEDAQTKAILDATFMELMSREAVMMHGTDEAFELVSRTMNDNLRPLAEKLDAFAADGSKVLTKNEVEALERDMAKMRNAIANVRENGIEIVGDSNVASKIEVDKSILDEMGKILTEVADQIKNAKSISLKRAVDAFIKEVGDSLSPKKAPDAGDVKADDDFMVSYNEAKNSLLKTLRDFADGKLTQQQFDIEIDNRINTFQTGDFRIVETKLRLCGVSERVAKDIDKTVCRLRIVKAQFKELMRSVAQQRDDNSEFSFASSDVRRLMLGEVGLSNVVEARVRGFKAGDVDSATEESNIADSRPLGSGAAGKTYLLTTKAGSELVFKAELDSRLGLDSMVFSIGNAYKDTQKAANLNLATQDTAKALGCADLVVKYSVGSHDGQFGFFMEKAKGYSGGSFATRKQVKGDGVAPTELENIKDDGERAKIQGELAKKLNRLMWLDLITGQGDRHWENYFVHIDKNTHAVTVNAIDNDASFTVRQIGIQKYALDKDTSDKFLAELKRECNELYGADAGQKEYDARVSKDLGIKENGDGTLTVDLAEAKSPEVKMALNNILGVHGIIIPEEIDKDLYDKLMTLKEGTAARRDYIESLRPRLSDEALEATVKRLDSAIEHAEKLFSEGKVYGDAQWKDPNVLSGLSERKTKEEIVQSDGRKVEVDDSKGQFVSEYFRTSCPSYYKRDYYDKMF